MQRYISQFVVFIGLLNCFVSAQGESLQSLELEQKQKAEEERYELFKTISKDSDSTIEFYGVVKDQYGDPAPNAKVEAHYKHFDLLSSYFQKSSKISASTDAKGCFVFKGLKGRSLFIETIEKEGYAFDFQKNGNRAFSYDATRSKIFVPDEQTPIVFIIHKKPEPGYVEKKNASKSIYLTGEEFEVDLEKGIARSVKQLQATTGDIVVSVMPGASSSRYNILIKTCKNEDLIIEQNRESHIAPENGAYKNNINFELKPDEEIIRNIYFKSHRDNAYIYARLQLKLEKKSSSLSCDVDLYTSLDGGRNFEYDERYTYNRRIQDLSRKIEHDPMNAQLYVERAELKRYMLDEEAALEDIKNALTLEPKEKKILQRKERLEKEIKFIKK